MILPARHLAWAKGGHAEIVSIDDDAIVLASTTPSPPGARLEAVVVLPSGSVTIKVKSHGSRREGESFVVRGRLLDATREMRVALAGLVVCSADKGAP